MPQETVISSRVTDGHLPDYHRQMISDTLALYEGKPIQITLRPPVRSLIQNAYLWAGIYNPIREKLMEAGIAWMEVESKEVDGKPETRPVSSQAVHEYFKTKFLPRRIEYVNGSPVVVFPSTKDLSTTEFSRYIEAIKSDELILQLGVHIEDPEPLDL